MKLLKKLLAGAMALTMLAGIAGCGEKDTSGEIPTVRIFFMDPGGSDVQMVEDAINAISREKIGVEIEMNFLGVDYNQKLPMMIATDEPMDICWMNSSNFTERVRTGAYADITDLLNDVPDLKNLFGDDNFWKGVTVKDRIYGVPTKKEMAEQWACYVDTEFLTEKNITIDPDKIYTLKELEPILEGLKADGREGFMISTKGQHDAIDKLNYFDVIMGDIVVDKETGKVESYYMSDEYEAYVRLMRDWYNKGYIKEDVATNQTYETDFPKSGLSYVGYAPCNEDMQVVWNKGHAKTPIKMTPITVTNESTCGSAFAVLEKSKNKEAAMKFLELWNTDPAVKNLMTFGIEGVHYELVDGRVKQIEDINKKYLCQNWASGNVMISGLMEVDPADKWERYEAFNKAAGFSSALGFMPETRIVNDKFLACQGAAAEFAGLLSTGSIDPDEYLPKLRKALEDAGINDVIAEMQKQFDAWKN